MDICFRTDEGKFNYRVGAIIINDGRILAMHDERSPYYYIPGGRVMMGETAEHAVIREIQEELHITPEIIRPLWLTQGFFTDEVDGQNYHELCVYFLMDISDTGILSKGNKFISKEQHRTHSFEWIEFERLKDEYFYPLFLKTEIFNLPDEFTIRTYRE